jgi:4-hydroxybenzoate polyprenyltransferase
MVIVIVWIFEFFSLRNDPITYAEVMQQLPIISIIVFSYALFAFMVSLIREMIKDVEDIEGDRSAKYRTLPIQMGIRNTKKLITFFIVLVILFLALAQYLLYEKSLMLIFWYVLIALQTLLLFLLIQIIKAGSKQEFHFLSNATKIIMVAGILSMQLFYISF